MESSIKLIIKPFNCIIHLTKGANLLEVLLSHGQEISVLCNKNGFCGKCRVVVKAETNPVCEVERLSLGKILVSEGYRLACRTEIFGNGEIFIPVESREDFLESLFCGDEVTAIREKNFPYPIVHPAASPSAQRKYSVALDLGTTTLTGYMFDPEGNLLSHYSFFNPTTLYGGDVITRITYLQNSKEGFKKLRNNLLSGIWRLLNTLCMRARPSEKGENGQIKPGQIYRIAVCGNTIMQHIFIGINPVDIGLFPYQAIVKDLLKIKAQRFEDLIKMGLRENTEIVVAPSVSGFIGGDAVCGVIATQLHMASDPELFIDLGTNGEMILNSKGNLFAASASAGPAFEGYRIQSGMRATIGAIDSVRIDEKYNIHYTVMGGIEPKGLCGTGAVSAVAALLKASVLSNKGHIIPPFETSRIRRDTFVIASGDETSTGMPVILTDKDIEVIQHAKAAFASGISCLIRAARLEPADLKKIYIAGAFGSRVDMESLKSIGLIPYEVNADVVSVGNAAGAGITIVLLSELAEKAAVEIANVIKTLEFSSFEDFEDEFLSALFFRKNAVC